MSASRCVVLSLGLRFSFSELGERGREISAKEIVSSIIYAANRKKKRKDKLRSGDMTSVEADMPSDGTYNERNIDLEVALRKGKESGCPPIVEAKAEKEEEVKKEAATQQEPAQRCATTRDGIYEARMVFLKTNNQEPPMPNEKDKVQNVEVKRYPAIPIEEVSTCSTENAKPMAIHHRRYSEDIVNDSKGSPSNRGGSSWSQGGLQRSRTEVDTAYRQNDIVKSSTPHSDKMRQVQYTTGWSPEAVTSQDTSNEDVLMHSVDSTSSVTGRSPDVTQKTDTMSTTSDYSTMSSMTSSMVDTRHLLQVAPTTSSSSTSSIQLTGANLRPSRNALPKSQSAEWRKCTISEGGQFFVMSSAGEGPSKYIAKDDSDLCKGQKLGKQVNGEDNVRRRKGPTPENIQDSKEAKQLVRRSVSLDSLLDQAQGHTHVSPLPTPASKSSEDEDLVTSMTATFDEKLKFLMDSSSTLPNTLPEHSCSLPVDRTVVPKAEEEDFDIGAIDREKRYRSPSLHKEQPLLQRMDRRMSDSSILDTKSDSAENVEEKESYAAAVRKSTEVMFGSRDKFPEFTFKRKPGLTVSQVKAASASPPVRKRVPKDKKGRRRHTVGGTTDLKNFKALVTVNQQTKSIERRSAWERLQPAVKTDTRDVHSWLQERRLHTAGSSPALLASSLKSNSHTRDTADTVMSQDIVRTRHAHSEPTSPGAIPTNRLQKLDLDHKFSYESAI